MLCIRTRYSECSALVEPRMRLCFIYTLDTAIGFTDYFIHAASAFKEDLIYNLISYLLQRMDHKELDDLDKLLERASAHCNQHVRLTFCPSHIR